MIQYEKKRISLIQKSEAIKLVETATEDTPIIIDFDETLFLRNSTSEYLNSLRPRIVGLLLLKFLYFIKPWSWFPKPLRGSIVQDWFLVTAVTILLPWTWFVWQKKARQLAATYQNKELVTAINNNTGSLIVIATLGFNFIIHPILNSLNIQSDRLVSCRFWQGAKDRTEGKLFMLQQFLSQEQLASSIVITDSYDDMPLLEQVTHPCLVIWPLAKYISPLKDVYLPFFYLQKVKRVGENYIPKVILWDDVPILFLAFSWQTHNPLLHNISIILLLISFWCVYEIGYYENDFVAEQYEEKPKLSVTYHSYKKMMQTWHPWGWSLVFGILGLASLIQAKEVNLPFDSALISLQFSSVNPILLPFTCWLLFLLTMRLCFWVYNYLNKHTRTWLYLLLQSFRYYGFLAVTATNMIGTILLSSHILSRTILYIVYRYSGGNAENWPKQVPEKLLRLLIFVFILSAIALGNRDVSLWLNWQTGAIIIWCLLQGQKQIFQVASQFKPVIQDGSNRVTQIVN